MYFQKIQTYLLTLKGGGVYFGFSICFFVSTKIAFKQNIKYIAGFESLRGKQKKHQLPFMSSSFINLVHHGLTITGLPLGGFFFKLNFDTFLSLH